MTGTTLSHYTIISELGRGGMGIVYLAEDTKLDRQVAIKVLPSSALASEDDRARFYREAKAAAALNHPNIAQIYQIDEAVPSDAPHGTQPSPFIAMEYIDGEPLDERIKRGPLKLAEAVRLATQIAGALGEAHEKGIVHRDVKASNVMLTSKGDAKVLDFGLALTAASTKLTRMGSTLGTVAYMSPEQARGEEVDRRTDLWALGVVLYEMVAGRNPFGGDYEQAVVYSILNADPEPLTAVRTGVPMELERIVNKALAKDRSIRYQTAGDLTADLTALDVMSGTTRHSRTSGEAVHSSSAQAGGPSDPARTAPGGRALWISVGLVAGLALATAGALVLSDAESKGTATYSTLDLPPGVTFEPDRSAPLNLARSALAITPDGDAFAVIGSFGSTSAIYTRRADEPAFSRLSGTEGAYGIHFDPTGERIAFFADNRLKVVPRVGGAVREVTSVSLPYGLVWFDGERVSYNDDEGSGHVVVDVTRGTVLPLTLRWMDNGEPFNSYALPYGVLPDGRILLTGTQTSPGTYAMNPDDQTVERLDSEYSVREPAGDDIVVYTDGTGLSVTRARGVGDVRSGRSVSVVDSLYRRSVPFFDTDLSGSTLFVSGPDFSVLRFEWVRADGSLEPLPIAPDTYGPFKLSPDGRSLAVEVFTVDGTEVRVFDLDRGSRQNLEGNSPARPIWSADGTQLYYTVVDTDGREIMVQRIGSSAAPESLGGPGSTPVWHTPDGAALGVTYTLDGRTYDLGYVRLDDPETPLPIPGTRVTILTTLSNAGDFVAYTTNKTGDYEIFVQPFPPDGREWQATTAGGEEPIWTPQDDAIVYRNGDVLLRTNITRSDGGPLFSRPDTLFVGPFENVPGYSIDISPVDGRVLVLRTPAAIPTVTSIGLVRNAGELLTDRRSE